MLFHSVRHGRGFHAHYHIRSDGTPLFRPWTCHHSCHMGQWPGPEPTGVPVLLTGVSVLLTGASVLLTGASVLLTGASVLLTGASVLLTGASVLLTGASVLLTGVSVLLTGASVLLTGVSVLLTGASILLTGASVLLTGVSILLTGASVLLTGASVLLTGVSTIPGSVQRTVSVRSVSFDLPTETEAGSAGEQPVRDRSADRDVRERAAKVARSFFVDILVAYAFENPIPLIREVGCCSGRYAPCPRSGA